MPPISLSGLASPANILIAFLLALVLIYLVLRLLLTPLKRAGKPVLRALFTATALIVINLLGKRFGYAVPLNPVTVLLPAALGLPGFCLVTLMQFLLF